MTPLNFFTYSSARRITRGSKTQCPSSLKTRTRATESAIAPISARCSPSKPRVTAPIGNTSSKPVACPSRYTCSTTPAVSATGEVFAIALKAVKPPFTPAREPDSTVSASSLPGSRRWVCKSTRPGRRMDFAASMTCAPCGSIFAAISEIFPSLIRRSDFVPSGSVPPEIRIVELILMLQSLENLQEVGRESPF